MPAAGAPAAARWRRLVKGRLEEAQRLAPDAGPLDGAFWDRLAKQSGRDVRGNDPSKDPFLRRLRRLAGPGDTALDVGAGRGRYVLALAPDLARVTAVDPSKGMLAALRRDAKERGLGNVKAVRGKWEDVRVEPADIAFSSFVMTLVPDAPAFIRKLEASARRHVLLYLGAYTGDGVLDPLWRHFHGKQRVPGATYIDALAVLRELGIEPAVKVVEIPNRMRFATIGEALEYYRHGLLLADEPEVNRELEDLLGKWLLGRRGAFRSPMRSQPAAILDWSLRTG